jgi:hypothetical protein
LLNPKQPPLLSQPEDHLSEETGVYNNNLALDATIIWVTIYAPLYTNKKRETSPIDIKAPLFQIIKDAAVFKLH